MICPQCKKKERATAIILGKRYLRKWCRSCLKEQEKPYLKYRKTRCDFCGFVAVDKCQLDIDHIDGNHRNNQPENLQTLCANCHRLKTFIQRWGQYRAG